MATSIRASAQVFAKEKRITIMPSWKAVKSANLDAKTIERVASAARAKVDELTLQELRQGLSLTQVEVAREANMTQSELSRMESRADHRISTLRRYVDALGGKLEISAVFGKRRVKLTDV
jgi:predicted transcriptional regulator